jgi:hypothetical protein
LNTEAKLVDIQGKVVKKFLITEAHKTIPINDLLKGVYMLQLADGSAYKVVKE